MIAVIIHRLDIKCNDTLTLHEDTSNKQTYTECDSSNDNSADPHTLPRVLFFPSSNVYVNLRSSPTELSRSRGFSFEWELAGEGNIILYHCSNSVML